MPIVRQGDRSSSNRVTAPSQARFDCEGGDPCYAVESEPHNFDTDGAYAVCYAIITIMMNCPSTGQDLWDRMFNGSWDYGLVPYSIANQNDAGYYVTGDNPPRARIGVNLNFQHWGDPYQMMMTLLHEYAHSTGHSHDDTGPPFHNEAENWAVNSGCAYGAT